MPVFRFTTYDPELIEIFEKLGHRRGVFIEVAVRSFLKTEKGQEFLSQLLPGGLLNEGGKRERKKKFSIDDFM